ncbi:putative phage tail domain protein [Yersinia pestis PY-36]|nr:putative phage tail domain protein [Yersinia pestis PY-36]
MARRIVSVCGCCIPHAWSRTLSALRQGLMLPSLCRVKRC